MNLGPQTHFGAKFQSLKGPYNWSQNREKWRLLFHGAEEKYGKECLWQIGAVSESVECEEG